MQSDKHSSQTRHLIYIAALKAAAAEADAFIAKNAEVIASCKAVSEAMTGMAGSAVLTDAAERNLADASADLMAQTALLASMDERLAAIQRDVADSSADLIMMNELLRGSLIQVDGTIDDVIAHLAALRATQSATAADGNRAAGLWLGWWRLSANAIHWIIAGTAEYLAVAIPGSIALGLGAFVLYQGAVEDVTRRLTALYTTTEATASIFGKTTGDVVGLGHAFQSAQNAANPVAYELLGAYINGARSQMVNFAAAGLDVDRALGELAARIDVDLRQQAGTFSGLLSHMVSDLIEFGQILGNIGHALLNFASDMPGLAEVLLKVADGISWLILKISELPRWVILSFMAFEEFVRWGGLLVRILTPIVTLAADVAIKLGEMAAAGALANLSNDMSNAATASTHFGTVLKTVFVGGLTMIIRMGAALVGLGAEMIAVAGEEGILAAVTYGLSAAFDAVKLAILAIPGWGWALAGIAAVAGLVTFLMHGKTAAQEFGDALESNIAKSTNVAALGTITSSIGKVNQQLADTPKYMDLAFPPRFGGNVRQVTDDYAELSATQQHMAGQFSSVADGADKISRAYGTNFAQSLALADVAGVKLANTQITLGKNANVAGQEIENLVAGYKAMDQVGGTIGADMNVLAIQSGLAGTKVSQLNQAWDQFIQNSTGLTSSLSSLNQDLTEVGNVGVKVGGKFEAFSGTASDAISKVAKSLESFSGTGAQTWQNYDAALNQAQQYTDNLRTAAAYGGISVRNFNGSIADIVGSMAPFATHSKTATSELSALAQEAGGPATDNLKTLMNWVDKNKISTKEFNQAMQDATGQMSNAGAAAAEFASTLQQQMQSALAAALLSGSNLNNVVGQFQQAVLKAGGQISTSSPQYKQLYDMLRAAGLSAVQAKNEMKELQDTIDGLHGKSINVTTNVDTVYSVTGGSQTGPGHPQLHQHGGVIGYQGGGVVGGSFGVDRVLAALSAGEAVLTARAVAAIGGPLGVHALNNQPSHAVLSAGGGGGGGVLYLTQHVTVELDGSKIASQWRTEQLTYNRRNNQSNTSLRTR